MASRKATMVEDVELPKDEEQEEVVEEPTDLSEEESPEEEEWDSYAMDPEEELFEGGPNFGQVNAWKEQYGQVYVSEFFGKYVVWRPLSRFEYRRLVKNLEQALSTGQVSQAEANLNNEESIAELCVLFPPYDRRDTKNMAGIASSIAQSVMDTSGFTVSDVRQL